MLLGERGGGRGEGGVGEDPLGEGSAEIDNVIADGFFSA